ncbi:hypothetical protein CesoFtcFv8_016074 [Champsocephalus esox]|uniref:Uncharacterized protein n=1 Tax=Champsocephalus esox TaxID=159716 RepID=A0AAN8BMR1_9TELE|nr:hypothetical protein CesoFtcFv8_016074 [Champsocephalus esox]
MFTVHGGDSAHDLPHLGSPRGAALCRFAYPTSAVTRILSSPLSGVLPALLGMRSENKHRIKDGKTSDISQRNTVAKVFPVDPCMSRFIRNIPAVNSSATEPYLFLCEHTSEFQTRNTLLIRRLYSKQGYCM